MADVLQVLLRGFGLLGKRFVARFEGNAALFGRDLSSLPRRRHDQTLSMIETNIHPYLHIHRSSPFDIGYPSHEQLDLDRPKSLENV